jgi:multidrug efflux pump subunit AcrB
MRGLLLSIVVVALIVGLWRVVFTAEEDRKAIRFGVKEVGIAVLAAFVLVVAVFLVISITTIRLI